MLLVPDEIGRRLSGVGEDPSSFHLHAKLSDGMLESPVGGFVIGIQFADRGELGRGQCVLTFAEGNHSVVEQLVGVVPYGGIFGKSSTTGWAVRLLHRHGLGTQWADHPRHLKSLPAS
ncbi:MAG: hypothetical protein WCF12_06300 [Propionicimonas sp.]